VAIGAPWAGHLWWIVPGGPLVVVVVDFDVDLVAAVIAFPSLSVFIFAFFWERCLVVVVVLLLLV